MRSTILSENQYEPRFITAAAIKPNISPFGPPTTSPMTSSRPLMAPRSRTVFIPFDMALLYSPKPAQQPRQKRRAPRQISQFDMFVEGVRAVAARTETV